MIGWKLCQFGGCWKWIKVIECFSFFFLETVWGGEGELDDMVNLVRNRSSSSGVIYIRTIG